MSDKTLIKRHNLSVVNDFASLTGVRGWLACTDEAQVYLGNMMTPPKWLNALGWHRAEFYERTIATVAWFDGAEVANGEARGGLRQNCCAPRDSVSWGGCKINICGFTELGRDGGVTCIYDSIPRTRAQPRSRIDGTQIENDFEWRASLAGGTIIKDAEYWLLYGDKMAGDNQTDGVFNLIKTGYTDSLGRLCPWLDSIVVNWVGGCIADDGSIWRDGRAIDIPIVAGTQLIDMIDEVVRVIMQRIESSTQITGRLADGEMYFLVSQATARCIMRCDSCYRTCGGDCSSTIDDQDARREYNELKMGGFYGDGKIVLPGDMEIPIVIGPDYLGTTGFLITRSVGGQVLNEGAYQDFRTLPSREAYPDLKEITDEGRFAIYSTSQGSCTSSFVDHNARLEFTAPWACARIDGLGGCNSPSGGSSSILGSANYYAGLPPFASEPTPAGC